MTILFIDNPTRNYALWFKINSIDSVCILRKWENWSICWPLPSERWVKSELCTVGKLKVYSRYHNLCHYKKAIFISKFFSCLFVCQCTFYQFPQIATTSISVLEDRISLLRRLSTCNYTVFANFEIFFDSFCTWVSAGTITRDSYFQYFSKSRNKKCLGIYEYIYKYIYIYI